MSFDKIRAAGVLASEVARLYSAELQRQLAPLGLTSAQFLVLSEIGGRDGLTQRDLTERLGVEQATMANTLNRMQRDGLIERRPHPEDGRAQIVMATAPARELVTAAGTIAKQVNDQVLAALPSAERELFLSMLMRMVTGLRDNDGGTGN